MATEAIAEDQTKRVSEGGTCDEFGFRIEEQHVAAFKRHQLAQAETRQAMREQWGLLVAELKAKDTRANDSVHSQTDAIEASSERTRAARKLLRGPCINGIAAEYRPFLWPLLCGVDKARAVRGEHVFPSLLQRCEGAERNAELALDLDRTFPGHPLLDKSSQGGREGIASLHRVLNSYSLYNPEVGYCQSMNFIVGILLIMDVQEEDAFWIMSHISDSLLPNHFAPPMLGCQVDAKVFKLLLRKHMGALAAHLDDIGLDPGMVCGQWFLCIFCNRMPCATACHIWDVVFVKGPQAIFQVALAIFKLCEQPLLACEDMGAAIEILRDFEAGLFDSAALLECAALEFGNVGDVGKMREELLPGVRKEYQAYRRRMDNYKLNENVKKGKELLRGFGGKAWELGNGLLAGASEVRMKASDPQVMEQVQREVEGKVKDAKAIGGGWLAGASTLLSTAASSAASAASAAASSATASVSSDDSAGNGDAGQGGARDPAAAAALSFLEKRQAFWNKAAAVLADPPESAGGKGEGGDGEGGVERAGGSGGHAAALEQGTAGRDGSAHSVVGEVDKGSAASAVETKAAKAGNPVEESTHTSAPAAEEIPGAAEARAGPAPAKAPAGCGDVGEGQDTERPEMERAEEQGAADAQALCVEASVSAAAAAEVVPAGVVPVEDGVGEEVGDGLEAEGQKGGGAGEDGVDVGVEQGGGKKEDGGAHAGAGLEDELDEFEKMLQELED